MGSGGFTAGQAAKVTGLKYATVDYWDRSGFLSPSVAGAQGKGSDRVYSFQDLIALRVARQLREAGISLQARARSSGSCASTRGSRRPWRKRTW